LVAVCVGLLLVLQPGQLSIFIFVLPGVSRLSGICLNSLLILVADIGRRTTLKMLRCKSKTQFVKQERNTKNAIALLNYGI
jgi:hypothetical protein